MNSDGGSPAGEGDGMTTYTPPPLQECADQRPELVGAGWKATHAVYVLGWKCPCGGLWSQTGPYLPWLPPPDVCPTCGAPRAAWQPRSLLRLYWTRKLHWWAPVEEMCTHNQGVPHA